MQAAARGRQRHALLLPESIFQSKAKRHAVGNRRKAHYQIRYRVAAKLPASLSGTGVASWQPVLPGKKSALWREFLLQVKSDFPVAIHVCAPDHDVDSALSYVAAFFGIVAVTVV